MLGSRITGNRSSVEQSDKANAHHDTPLDIIETSGVIDESGLPNGLAVCVSHLGTD